MNFWGKNKQLPKNATSPEITEFLINHNAYSLTLINTKHSTVQSLAQRIESGLPSILA